MINAEGILNGDVVDSGDANNAVATASKAATLAQRHFALGFFAAYSVAVALIKTITFKRGSTTVFILRWDFSKGPCCLPLPSICHGDYNQAISVELEASGTGGTNGRVQLFYFTA
jgi:hypothetical protein